MKNAYQTFEPRQLINSQCTYRMHYHCLVRGMYVSMDIRTGRNLGS